MSLALIKKNKILLLKIFISITVLCFIVASVVNITYMFINEKYFYSIALIYLLIIVIINYIAEFSPYLLYKYIIQVFPNFQTYSGRMWPYIICGTMYMCPELNLDALFTKKETNASEDEKYNLSDYLVNDFFDYSFYVGLLMIITGILCYAMHNLIYMNKKLQDNQLLVMSKNYEDYNYTSSVRNSLNYQLKGKEMDYI